MRVIVTLNDFKERVILRKFVYKGEGDDSKRSLKKSKGLWGAVQSLPLQNAMLASSGSDVVDGRIRLSKAYTLYFKIDPGSFDGVTWRGESYRRVSALQRAGQYWRCIIAAFEEKEL